MGRGALLSILKPKICEKKILKLDMFQFFLNNIHEYCDAPRPWGIYFQDSAAPQMEALVELHDNIMYYLITILFGVVWILTSIVRNYASTKSPISHKYLNHGAHNVPIHNNSDSISSLLSEVGRMMKVFSIKFLFNVVITKRALNLRRIALFIYILGAIVFQIDALFTPDAFSILALPLSLGVNSSNEDKRIVPEKFYENADTLKKLIIDENKNKSGIYRWTNKSTGDIYIGQSTNLSSRFINYYNISYLSSKIHLIISRALIKYGYSKFSLEILEYCDKSVLLKREQYYLDKLNPSYNILKLAGSSKGFKHSEETKAKISKSLKGIYTGNKSALFGRVHSEETKILMSLKKAGDKNPIFGKTLSDKTKELIKQRALGRTLSEETKALLSLKHGNPVNLYEKNYTGEFSLIGSFVSVRKAAKFLDISAGTVTRYMQSGKLFKDKYKFSTH